jgi:RimJ/RimL family protein N-acetyltransferase
MTSNIPHPYRYEDASAFLSGPRAKPLSQSRLFAIEHRAFGVIGMIGLTRKDKFATELGYWLGRTFWGRGLATEAADAVTAWAFDVWGRRVILASHFADNPASGRVLIKTGFLYTGEVRPLYSVSRGEAASARMMICLT